MAKDDCERCGGPGGLHLMACPAVYRWVPRWDEKSTRLSGHERAFIGVLAGFALMVVVLLFVALFGGCHVGELAAPCDTATLEHVKQECRAAVRANCSRVDGVVDETCPTLLECSRRVQSWRACSTDGGVR